MTLQELTEAAERVVAYRYRDYPDLSPEETKVALVERMIDAGKVCRAFLADTSAAQLRLTRERVRGALSLAKSVRDEDGLGRPRLDRLIDILEAAADD